MKSYNGLYDAMLEHDAIVSAIRDAAKGKTDRPVVRRALLNIDAKAEEIAGQIRSGRWRPPQHKVTHLQEGYHKKERDIIKPRWDNEQIVHHMLVDQLKKIVMPRIYRYACGSIPGRGTHCAARTMRRWRDGYRGKRFYVAELDLKKFYASIDHDILKGLLRRRIRDKRYLEILFRVIDACPEGLPLGNYTSPWFANFYFSDADNFILQELKPDHYLRYMDNLYLFSRNKRKLHAMVRALDEWVRRRLKLRLKENWQVYRFEDKSGRGRAINALGFMVHRNRVTIRKNIIKRIRAKANRMGRRRRLTYHDACAFLSQAGYIYFTDSYGYYLRWIKPKVSIQRCKRRVSGKNRKENAEHDKLEDRARGQGTGASGHDEQRVRGVRAPEHPAGDGDGHGRHGADALGL